MSTLNIILHLLQHLSLLVALTVVYNWLMPTLQRFRTLVRETLQGILFGLFAVMNMVTTLEYAPGFMTDGRMIVLAVAGYAGGIVPGLVCAVIVSIFRVYMGGAGTAAGVAAAFTCAFLGAGFRWYHQREQGRSESALLLTLGALSALNVIVWAVLLAGERGGQVIQLVILPLLILFPLGTWLLGKLITDQQRHRDTVEALAVERSMLRTLIDNVPDYIFIKDKNGRFILSNIAHARAAQAQTDQILLGKTANSFFPTAFAEQYNQDDQMVLQGQEILSQERRTVDADGNLIWVTTTKVPMHSSTGEIIGVVGISRNVTERKQAEEALQRSEKKYRQIIEMATEGIWMIDKDGRITFVNPRMAALLGYTPEEMIGRPLSGFASEEQQGFVAEHLKRRREGIAEEFDFKLQKKDGSPLWAIVSAAPLTDDEGNYAGSQAMVTDITERKRAEEQTMELAAERQRVQVLKHFISDISHDFRTPLTVLQTSLFILRKTATDRQFSRIDILEAQVQRLTRLFDEMLDMYSLENEERVWLDPRNINDIIGGLVDKLQAEAQRKQQVLGFTPGENVPPIPIDPPRFEHAMMNILQNALNFTPESGAITVRTDLDGEQAVVVIQDTGIGIQPEALPHIFEHFYRADRSRSSQTGGSGLGLSIARKIVEAHGGTITVNSTPGEGSTFRVVLPIPALNTSVDSHGAD